MHPFWFKYLFLEIEKSQNEAVAVQAHALQKSEYQRLLIFCQASSKPTSTAETSAAQTTEPPPSPR
jgi:hypothetical protein